MDGLFPTKQASNVFFGWSFDRCGVFNTVQYVGFMTVICHIQVINPDFSFLYMNVTQTRLHRAA